MKRSRVAGGGIGGLATGWLLDRPSRVTLLGCNARLGGHTNTLTVDDPLGAIPVATGFIAFNHRKRPLLTALLKELDVVTYPTTMSFSASLGGGRTQYSGSNLNGLVGQRSNLFKRGFLRLLADILRFNAAAKAFLARVDRGVLTLGEFLEHGRHSQRLADHDLLPMAAAIWSCPTEQVRPFPLLSYRP